MIAVTNGSGYVVSQSIYDPFGKKTDVYLASKYSNFSLSQPTERGYTGHKHLSHVDIIHMNGRIYDPTLGRFLQADPHIQAPMNSQNYNRYSYVLNNPMSYTDPTGYFFKSLGKFVKKYWRVIAAAVVTYFTAGLAAGWATSWAVGMGMTASATAAGLGTVTMLSTAGSIFVGAVSGAIAGAAGGFVATGSLKGASVGALSGAVFGAIGGGFKAYGVENTAAQMAVHATAGGVLSDVQGGKFGHGFISAGIMKGVGKIQTSATLARTLVQAIAGGTVSKITGGKFANGAVTSAIQFIVNEISYKLKRGPTKVKENYKKHKNIFVEKNTETLGVIDASPKLITPELGIFSDSILQRTAAKLSIGAQLANLVGTVDVTTTNQVQYSEDLYEYEFEVFKDGTLINDSFIDYSTEINYESRTVIGSKFSFSGTKWFWE